jgi:uncharacterized protein YkwD
VNSYRRAGARAVLASALLVVGFAVLAGPPAAATTAEDEAAMWNLINGSRAGFGLGPLTYDAAASNVARTWTQHMVSTGVLAHNPNLVSQINAQVTDQWTRLGENVGYGPSAQAIENAFMASSAHKANILGDYNRVGVGTGRGPTGTLWVTVVFIKGPAIPPNGGPNPPPAMATWYQRNQVSSGNPDNTFAYGTSGDRVLSCDWNGDGTDTIGVYVNGWWYLRNTNSAGTPDIAVNYGAAGYIPVCGDWDADGIDTIGVYVNGMWYLRNTNTAGGPSVTVSYGMAGYLPTVGDWNADGKDTIGVFTAGMWYLRNTNTPGKADVIVNYGAVGYQPVTGDWDGDGKDTIGVYTNGWWYLRNNNNAGAPQDAFAYGAPGWKGVPGDWNDDGVTSIAAVPGGA